MTQRKNYPSIENLKQQDIQNHWHPFTDHGKFTKEDLNVIVQGDGPYVWDGHGNKILDGMAGLWCMNVGYGRREIVDAVSRQMLELPYYNTFFKTTHPPVAALSAKLAEITPGDLNRIFFTGSGSESNDTVLRLVRTYWAAIGKPKKTVVIARKNAYHGSTMAGVGLGGMSAMHSQGGPQLADIEHIDQPYWFQEGGDMDVDEFGIQRARELERKIDALGEGRVAAFIAEPIQGAGGVIIPPASYWPEVMRICKQREILFVADEVICGFGRLGEWFGSTHYDLDPDIISMAKGLSSGYLPIGAVAVSDKVAEGINSGVGEFFHGYTYSGHPACAAAALANIDILETENIISTVRDSLAAYFKAKWETLGDHPLVGEARARGMVAAIEIVPNKPARTKFENPGEVGVICRDFSFSNGLIMRAVNDTMIVSPPLIISENQIDEMVEKAWKSLDQTGRKITNH